MKRRGWADGERQQANHAATAPASLTTRFVWNPAQRCHPLVSFTWRDTRVLFPSSHPSPTTAPPSPPRPLTIANNRCAVERERSPSEIETEQCVCRSFSQELVHTIRKFGDGDDDRKHHLRFLFPSPPSCTKLPWQTAVHQVLLQEKATGIRPLTFHFFFPSCQKTLLLRSVLPV